MIPAEFAPLAGHIWQSTLFAAAAVLLTLALRRNHARVRYAILLIASYKFLIPFSWLVSLGREFEWRSVPAALPHAVSTVTGVIGAPAFLMPAVAAKPAPDHLAALPLIIWAVWGCGSLVIVAGWAREWLRIRAMIRAATPLPFALPIPVVSVPSRIEPGVFGIFRPVLLLPEGVAEKLSPAQMHVVLAHELCHVRRRDNLASAMHMLVEALFWFHPLVWWLDRQIVEERERACDEEVLRMGGAPVAYADTILAVCKSYVESPIACISGISGSDLKRRVVNVMANRRIANLSPVKKVLISALGIIAVAGPVMFGIANAPLLLAQSSATTDWEKTAGGEMSFEVASLKENSTTPTRETIHENVPLTADGEFTPTGGWFSAVNVPLHWYIRFAYKLSTTQFTEAIEELPKWAVTSRYDISARAMGNPTKDQYRLMMQSLLANRFKLTVHYEQKEVPVFALVLNSPGRLGPNLQHHRADIPCPSGVATDTGAEATVTGGFPKACGVFRQIQSDEPGYFIGGARNVPMPVVADILSLGRFGTLRPVIDRTGLNRNYDFVISFYTQPVSIQQNASEAKSPVESRGPTFLEALKDQLGLKLVSSTGTIDGFVIDHIEHPTPN